MESPQSSQHSGSASQLEVEGQCHDYGPIEPEPDTTFYFESDHLALKANIDYLKMLKHIALLEVQRKLIVQDLEFYYDLEKEVQVSKKPSEVAKKIANREMAIPPKRKIAKRPTIDWTKYNIQAGNGTNQKADITKSIKQEATAALSASHTLHVIQAKQSTKPETFNKPWSAEEQIRLEELLLKYPPEASDSARFRKIALELGSRTLTQVCSRVQKYQKKMKRLGQKTVLFSTQKPKRAAKILHKQNKMLVRESTFLPALSVQSGNKIFMDLSSEEESDKEVEQNEEGNRMENRNTMEQWIRILERIKRDKGSEEEMKSVIHYDIQCHVCKEEPIIGTRWHCLSCSCEDTSINMCNDCTVLQLHNPETQQAHPLHHLLHPYPVQNFQMVTSDGRPLDLNYLPSNAYGSTSYLDPNMRTQY